MSTIPTVFDIHGRIAEGLAPLGGVLRCKKCGHERSIARGALASYLRNGWPEHCGQVMIWITERQLKAEAEAAR